MGTNYFLRLDACDKCGRSDHQIHIGKSSSGWTFTFHAVKPYESVDDIGEITSEKQWREVTKRGRIFDEYRREISYNEFWKLVDNKRNETFNHAKECIKKKAEGHWLYQSDESYLDDEGSSMSPGEFS